MNALEQALYTTLTADTGTGGVNHASTGATGGFHNPVAPQKVNGQPVGYPRMHFQELLNTAIYSFQNLNADHCYYQFTVFTVDSNEEGIATAGRLAERARALLTDPIMSVTGKSLLYSRYERSIPVRAEWDDTNSRNIYSKGFILELWLA